jgi:uncharacterized protein
MGNTALVTGASSGIGLELARLLAADGHDLVLVARSEGKLRELATELAAAHKIKTHVYAVDLGDPAAPAEIARRLAADGLAIDVLINNAGFGTFGLFHSETDGKFELQMIQVNVVALTELSKLLLPAMVKRGRGRIMNVASTAAFQPGPLMAVYYATKAYVLSFSEALAEEVRGSGVTVNAFCPGPTQSGFTSIAKMEDSKLFKGKKVPTSAVVARDGYRAMVRGRTVYIPGFMNWLLPFLQRFSPRAVVRRIVKRVQARAS